MIDIEKVKQHLEAAKSTYKNFDGRASAHNTALVKAMISEVSAALALLTPEAVKPLEWVFRACGYYWRSGDYRIDLLASNGKFTWMGAGVCDQPVETFAEAVAACQLHADSRRGGGVVDTLKRLREKIRQTKPDKAVCDFYYDGYAKARDNAVACVDALIDEEVGK